MIEYLSSILHFSCQFCTSAVHIVSVRPACASVDVVPPLEHFLRREPQGNLQSQLQQAQRDSILWNLRAVQCHRYWNLPPRHRQLFSERSGIFVPHPHPHTSPKHSSHPHTKFYSELPINGCISVAYLHKTMSFISNQNLAVGYYSRGSRSLPCTGGL